MESLRKKHTVTMETYLYQHLLFLRFPDPECDPVGDTYYMSRHYVCISGVPRAEIV
jgi:hypothetical protein